MSDDTQETPGTAQTHSELVRRVQALAIEDERREQAISSLRLFADPIDYDLMLKVGDLGGVELV